MPSPSIQCACGYVIRTSTHLRLHKKKCDEAKIIEHYDKSLNQLNEIMRVGQKKMSSSKRKILKYNHVREKNWAGDKNIQKQESLFLAVYL